MELSQSHHKTGWRPVPGRRHGKNLNSDQWRQMQLRKATTGRQDHPFAKFATGSYETLMSGPKVLPPLLTKLSTSTYAFCLLIRSGSGSAVL